MQNTHRLKTKASRRKLRRWSFTAVVTHPPVDKDGKAIVNAKTGEPEPAPAPITRAQRGRKVKDLINGPTFELRSITLGSSVDANNTALEIQREMHGEMLKSNPGARVIVFPVPHETISDTMVNQMQGFKDHNDILQLAFELSIKEALELNGLGPSDPLTQDTYSQNVKEAKDRLYKQAMDTLRPPKSKEEKLAQLESEPVLGSDVLDSSGATPESGELGANQPA